MSLLLVGSIEKLGYLVYSFSQLTQAMQSFNFGDRGEIAQPKDEPSGREPCLLSGTHNHVISNPQWVSSPRNLTELLAFRESRALHDG